jgi:hypothetical protein
MAFNGDPAPPFAAAPPEEALLDTKGCCGPSKIEVAAPPPAPPKPLGVPATGEAEPAAPAPPPAEFVIAVE